VRVTESLDFTLDDLALPSGAFAMLAIDQRESLRNMFADRSGGDRPSDQVLVDFKQAVAAELAGVASAMLIDQQYGHAAIEALAAAPGCGLIVAADRFVQPPGRPVLETSLDPEVDLVQARRDGAVAAKLLMIWDGGDEAPLRELVDAFLERCRAAQVLSVLEVVVRPPAGGSRWSRESAIVAAAARFAPGADLYKCEVPFLGESSADAIRRESERVTEVVPCPWVVLSSGVPAVQFPAAVMAACSGGASGFLAGRAIWADTVGPGDYRERIRRDSIGRMAVLTEIVNQHARPWRQASEASITG
jgi:sulfofructosephosphate aldolase